MRIFVSHMLKLMYRLASSSYVLEDRVYWWTDKKCRAYVGVGEDSPALIDVAADRQRHGVVTRLAVRMRQLADAPRVWVRHLVSDWRSVDKAHWCAGAVVKVDDCDWRSGVLHAHDEPAALCTLADFMPLTPIHHFYSLLQINQSVQSLPRLVPHFLQSCQTLRRVDYVVNTEGLYYG